VKKTAPGHLVLSIAYLLLLYIFVDAPYSQSIGRIGGAGGLPWWSPIQVLASELDSSTRGRQITFNQAVRTEEDRSRSSRN
jgi:hypothetical protein